MQIQIKMVLNPKAHNTEWYRWTKNSWNGLYL